MDKIPVSNGDNNSLDIVKADIDGVHIVESENTKNRVYLYYSEFDNLIQKLRKVKYEWKEKQIRGQQRLHSKEKPNNADSVYKSFGVSSDKEKYANYLRSDEWKLKRKQRLQFDAYRCCDCGGFAFLEVHHKSYANFGAEDVKVDLVTLCRNCHYG